MLAKSQGEDRVSLNAEEKEKYANRDMKRKA